HAADHATHRTAHGAADGAADLAAHAAAAAHGAAQAAEHAAEHAAATAPAAAEDAADLVTQLVGHPHGLLVGLIHDVRGRVRVDVAAADGGDQLQHGRDEHGGHVVGKGLLVAADPGRLHFRHKALDLVEHRAGELLLLAHARDHVADITPQELKH